MTHKFSYAGNSFEIHSFDYSYSTDSVNGAPAQHGSISSLDIEVQMESAHDAEGKNFKNARKILHKAAMDAITLTGEKLKGKIELEVMQTAQDTGSRKITLKGWCSSYHESSHGGPQTANADSIRATFYIFAKGKEETGPEIA